MEKVLPFRFKPKDRPREHDFVLWNKRHALVLEITPTQNGGVVTAYMLDTKQIVPISFNECRRVPFFQIGFGLVGLITVTTPHFGKTVVEEGYWNNILHVMLYDGRTDRKSSYIAIRELQFTSPFWTQNHIGSEGA